MKTEPAKRRHIAVRSLVVLAKVLKWTVIVVVALVLIVRASLPWAVPFAARKVGEPMGLAVRVDDFSLSVFGGEVGLSGIDVRAREGQGIPVEEQIVGLDSLTADLAMRDLFDGVVRIENVALNGLSLGVERRADGTIALPAALEAKLNAPPDPPDPDEVEEEEEAEVVEPEAPKPYDFTLPVIVDRVTVANLRVHARDRMVEPALDHTLDLDLDLTDLGVKDKPFALDLRVAVPRLLETLRIGIGGKVEGPEANVAVSVEIHGLMLAPIAPYLKPAGITPIASQLDAGLRLSAVADARGRPAQELAASAELEKLWLEADLHEAFALDRVELKVDRLSDAAIDVARVLVSGLRGAAERRADGTLRVAGFSIDPNASAPTPASGAPSSSDPRTPAPTSPVAKGDAPAAPEKPAPVIGVGEVRVESIRFAFRDEMQSPPIEVAPELIELETRDLVIDANVAENPVSVRLALGLPGIIERLDLAARTAVTGDSRTFGVELGAKGVNAVDLKPWLENSGIEPTIANGELALALAGSIEPPLGAPRRIDAKLSGVTLKDGAELFGLDGLAVEGVTLTPEKIEIGAVALENPRISVRLEKDGTLIVPGVRIPGKPAELPSAPAGATPEPGDAASESTAGATGAAPPAAAPQPEIVLNQLTWKGSRIRFEDATLAKERAFTLADADLLVEKLRLTAAGIEDPARVRFAASIDGLLRALVLDVTATAKTGDTLVDAAATVDLQVSGIDMAALDPYIAGTGIDPQFDAADFGMRAVVLAKLDSAGEGRTQAGVEVTDLRLGDGTNTLFGLARVAVTDAVIEKSAIGVGSVELSGVRLGAERRADGSVIACGVMVVPPAAELAAATTTPGSPTSPTSPTSSGSSAASEAVPASGEPAAVTGGAAPASPAIRLGRLAVDDVRVAWKDGAVTPAVDTAVAVTVGVEALELKPEPPPAKFVVGLALDGSLDRLAFEGTVVPNPDDLRLAANLMISGLRPDAVAGYLVAAPPITLRDGRLETAIEARLGKAADGGQSASLSLDRFVYRDGEQEPFLSFDHLGVAAPRLDAANGVFQVAELALGGLEVGAEKTAEGEVRLLGIALPPPQAVAVEMAKEQMEKAAAETAAAPSSSAAAGTPTGTVTPPAALALLAEVGSVDLEVRRARFVDGTRPGAPFESSLRVKSAGPIVIDSTERTEAAPPIRLDFVSHVEPLGSDLALRVEAEPLASEPYVKADFVISKIDAEKLAAFVPGIFDTSEPPRVRDGVFAGSVEGRLVFRRRGPLDFDVAHGFGAVMSMKDVAFREKPEGEILAGLDAMRVSVKRMAPATGDVHVDQIEITTPRLELVKRAAYTEIAGFRFPNPPPAPVEAVVDAPAPSAPAEVVASPPPVVAAPPSSPTPKPEIRVDELLVHGIAVHFRDETLDPPLVLPLEKLEVEVRNATTRALEQAVPVRFNITLGAGEVDLPKRQAPEPLVPSLGSVGQGVTDLGGNALAAGLGVGEDALNVGGKALGAGAEQVGKIGGAVTDVVGGALGGLGFGDDEKEKEEKEKEEKEEEDAKAAEEAAAAAAAVAAAEATSAEPAEPPPPVPTEKRLLFEEIELKGQVALVPSLKGNVDLRIVGFELLGVRGAANQAGVVISDGLMDLGVQTRLLGLEGIAISTVTAFDGLSMTEPENGPIARYLQLPAPLDVVIFALRDEEGVTRIPLRVQIKPDDVSIAGIVGAVASTLAQMVGRAIAHSPLRAVGTVGDIGGAAMDVVGLENVGIDQGLSALGLGPEEAKELPREVTFKAAETIIDPAERAAIAAIAAALVADPEAKVVLTHRLTSADVSRATERVIPTREAIDEIVASLRQRRALIYAERGQLEATARASYVHGDPWTSREPTARLREMYDELGNIEEHLDQFLDLTAPEAARRKDALSRAASLMIASRRLNEVRHALIDAGGKDIATRIEAQTPRFQLGAEGASAVLFEMRKTVQT